MDIATDLLLGVVPALTGVGMMMVAFVYWLAFRANSRPRERVFFVEYFYWLTDPLVDTLVRFGVTPNSVTVTSLIFSVAAGFVVAKGLFFTTLFILLVGASCDVLDGQVARRSHMSSKSGAFLDSFIDRLAEGALLTGVAWLGNGGGLTLVAFLAMVASFSVSYARARGDSLGVDAKVGIMQRPTRMVMILVLLFVSAILTVTPTETVTAISVLTVGLSVLTVLSAFTAYRRVRYIMNALSSQERPVFELHTPPAKSAA